MLNHTEACFCYSVFRTDFYRIMNSENDRLGFPPGVAIKLLMNVSAILFHIHVHVYCVNVCVCVCVCAGISSVFSSLKFFNFSVCTCVCVCVCEREREL